MAGERKKPEFVFDHDCTNSGLLTVRCLSLRISTDETDDFSDSELVLIEEIVKVLNQHYKLPK